MPATLPTYHGSLLLAAMISAVVSGTAVAQQGTPTMAGAPSPGLIVDVVAADRTGALVDDLTAGDFVVSVDGVRRTVRSVRYVTRGPGALNDTRSLQANRLATGRFAAEPARTVIVVIDQTTLVRGDEKATTAAVRRVIDRLGLDDRIGLVKLPLTGTVSLTLSNDRPALVASLGQVMGQATLAGLPAPADPFATSDADRPVALNPERAGSTERAGTIEPERPSGVDDRSSDRAASDGGLDRGNLPELRALFASLEGLPGRKTVMLFSGGLTVPRERGRIGIQSPDQTMRMLVDDVSLAAARAHVVVETFRLGGARVAGSAPDASALEALARATSGQFATMGRNVDQVVGRVLAGLSSCYVLGLDGSIDTDARRALTVTALRAGVVVRAPAWLVTRPDAEDWIPPAAVAESAPPATPLPLPLDPAPPVPQTPSTPPAPPAQLRRLLARVADYVDTYQREYSSVVAEEDYEQTDRSPGASTTRLRLTSDLLLVRLDQGTGWVSFRDIYEVNGTPLRERELRLQRLFLDPSVEGRAKLDAIQFESSKYNIGPVKRTVNAPLFSLLFLERTIQPRFSFALEDTREVDGLPVSSLGFQETASPTIAGTEANTDQPAQGRFLVDPVSGSIVESRTVYARKGAGQVEYQVRYRRDEKLGLWLPTEMKETYSVNGRMLTLGVARYRNFRRFQVTTDTRVTVPK